MPIVFNKEKGGWGLEDPSEEERQDLQEFAVQYVREAIGTEIANELLKRMMEFHARGKVLDALPVETMPQA